MLSNEQITEAIHNAMALHASLNNGKTGVSKNGIRHFVRNLGGDEEDVREAMLISLKMMSAECWE